MNKLRAERTGPSVDGARSCGDISTAAAAKMEEVRKPLHRRFISTRCSYSEPASEVNPLAREGSEGMLTSGADVCIVGAGITGVSAAYHLARLRGASGDTEPLSVVILEARDFCELYFFCVG